MNWEALTIREMLGLSRGVLLELQRRQVVRTDNAPLGDVAEYLVHAAFGGSLVPNSGKSYDLIDADDRKIQVKARTILHGKPGTQVFSPFRTFDFDATVFLVFDRNSMDLLRAVEVEAEKVRGEATYRSYVNGYIVRVSKVVRDEGFGNDVKNRIGPAYESMSGVSL